MRWEVRVRGDADDLESLCGVVIDPAATLRRSGDEYILSSTRFQESTEPDDVLRIARTILNVLSGIRNTRWGFSVPLEVAGVTKVSDDGSPAAQFIFGSGIESSTRLGRGRVSLGDNTQTASTPSDPISTWFDVAINNGTVASVFERLSDPDSWSGLYNIYEIVRADVGGDDEIVSRKWANKAQCVRFRRTACSPEILGPRARHGVQTQEAPTQPMDLPEASAFIRSLVQRWVTEMRTKKGNS